MTTDRRPDWEKLKEKNRQNRLPLRLLCITSCRLPPLSRHRAHFLSFVLRLLLAGHPVNPFDLYHTRACSNPCQPALKIQSNHRFSFSLSPPPSFVSLIQMSQFKSAAVNVTVLHTAESE
jgi:hypothetical protein